MSLGLIFSFSFGVSPAWGEVLEMDSHAADELVSGDNPGIINVTSPAPRLTLITEQMVSASFPSGATQLALPSLMARLGLLDWLEVRTILPSAVLTFPQGASTQVDVDQLGVGAVFATSFNAKLSGSLVPMLVVPIVADDGVGAPGVEGNLQANLSYTINEQWTLAGAVRTGWIQLRSSPEQLDARFALRGGVLAQFCPVPELALFVQSYFDYVTAGSVEPSVGGGLSYWVVPHVALFFEAGSGLTEGSPPVQAALGAVVQWW